MSYDDEHVHVSLVMQSLITVKKDQGEPSPQD